MSQLWTLTEGKGGNSTLSNERELGLYSSVAGKFRKFSQYFGKGDGWQDLESMGSRVYRPKNANGYTDPEQEAVDSF